MTPAPAVSPRDIRLSGMREAIAEVRAAVARNDEGGILRATNNASSNLYGLWTAYGIRGTKQVEWAGDDPEKRSLVGLVYARGEADHRQGHLAMAVGYGEAPYGRGAYGGGWMWQRLPTERESYAPSQKLYDAHVLWQSIPGPLDEALGWLERNAP